MPATYKDFLLALLALGPKLPKVWDELQAIVAHVQALIGLVMPPNETPAAGTLSIVQALPDELELETRLALHLAGPTAAFDGTILRGVFAFLRDNPALFTLIMSLLKGG